MKKIALVLLIIPVLLMPVFCFAAFVDEAQNIKISELQSEVKSIKTGNTKMDEILKAVKKIESMLTQEKAEPAAVSLSAGVNEAAATVDAVKVKPAAEQTPVSLKFSGMTFFRYSYILKGNKQDATSTTAFSIPRAFIGITVKNSDEYEANIIIDIPNLANAQNGVDFGAWLRSCYLDVLKLPVKDLRLRLGQQKIYFGTGDTWPYPMIEIPVENKYSLVDNADMGIGLLWKLPAGIGKMEAAIYNGSGYKKMETNAEKAYDISLKLFPLFFIENNQVYLRNSFYRTITSNIGEPVKNYYAFCSMLGFKTGPVSGHLQYFFKQDDKAIAAGKSGFGHGFSAYGAFQAFGPFSVLARFDYWNPDSTALNDDINLYVLGINYDFTKDVIFQVNYQVAQPVPGALGKENKFLIQTKWYW